MYGFIREVIAEKGEQVYLIPPRATVREAVREMNRYGVGALVVVGAGNPEGIFTERDVLRRVVDTGRDPDNTRVRDVMSRELIAVRPDTPVDQAMEMMTRMRCRHFPVVDAGRLAGIVSIGDLMRWVHIGQQHELGRMADYITGRQPA